MVYKISRESAVQPLKKAGLIVQEIKLQLWINSSFRDTLNPIAKTFLYPKNLKNQPCNKNLQQKGRKSSVQSPHKIKFKAMPKWDMICINKLLKTPFYLI